MAAAGAGTKDRQPDRQTSVGIDCGSRWLQTLHIIQKMSLGKNTDLYCIAYRRTQYVSLYERSPRVTDLNIDFLKENQSINIRTRLSSRLSGGEMVDMHSLELRAS